MIKVIQFAIGLAIVYYSVYFAWYYPVVAMGLINGYWALIKLAALPFPQSFEAVIYVLFFFLFPALFFLALGEALVWGVRMLIRACVYLWNRAFRPPKS